MTKERIVVKIGTSTLAHPSGLLNIRRVEALCKVLSDLKNAGYEIILVSSGPLAWAWESSPYPTGRRTPTPSRPPPQWASVN